MTTRRRSRLLARLHVTPRLQRGLEATFRAEMRALRQRLKEPHPREPLEQFWERLFVQFEDVLERYQRLGLFTGMRRPAPRGRRPVLSKEPNAAPGRPRRALAERVATVAIRENRPIPHVARELLLAEMRRHEPRRYDALMALARDHAEAHTLSATRALIRAFASKPFRRDLEALIRTSRNHLNGRGLG